MTTLAMLGCSEPGGMPEAFLDVNNVSGPDAAAGDGGSSNVIDAGSFTISSTKPGFQTKSAAQLASSVRACFGPMAMMITSDMIQTPPAMPSAILPMSFTPTTAYGVNDIVNAQKSEFDGDPQLLRTGTRADALSLGYVTAQRNVANVVAKNCAAGASPALCGCATLPEATAMARRCLPHLDPTSPELLTAAQVLQGRCAVNPSQAIASFVASAALSKLP